MNLLTSPSEFVVVFSAEIDSSGNIFWWDFTNFYSDTG